MESNSNNKSSSVSDVLQLVTKIPVEEKRIDLVFQNACKFAEAIHLISNDEYKTEAIQILNKFEIGNSFSQPSNWQLRLSQDRKSQDSKNHISLYLHRLKSNSPNAYEGSVLVHMKIVEVNTSGWATFEHNQTRAYEFQGNKDGGFGWRDFLELKGLVDITRQKRTTDDHLTIKCHLKFIYMSKQLNSSTSKSNLDIELRLKSKEEAFQSLQSMFQDIQDLENPVAPKIILHLTKDDVKLNVHRDIICARSQVFAQMFENEMKEKQTGIVQIDMISSDVMKIVLEYLYTGKLPSINPEDDSAWLKVPAELIDAAEKYELNLLKEFCDQNLLTACTPKNAIKLFKTAQLYGLKLAEEGILNYIQKNVKAVLLDHSLVFPIEGQTQTSEVEPLIISPLSS